MGGNGLYGASRIAQKTFAADTAQVIEQKGFLF